ncbi:hypothetical protein [Chitinophaga flava]|uniref:Uncharacterized protein n=1 Tax=Chitinophaga flava TaxID=2259036 RepID=A0A365Y0V5_9BACT|nr:hypothetical protein [Chitinophaga flava]RBL91938.1 hypothetical protein DF182_04880 [Chitinophaga flava]
MEGFRISNNFDKSMLVIFEPIGDTFWLPSGEELKIVPYDKGAGLGTDCLDVKFSANNGEPCVVIWAETHKFSAYHQGKQVNVM